MKAKKNTLKIILINLLAMLAVLVAVPLIVLAWLDSYTLHGKTVDVPDVCGMQLEDAAETLNRSALDFEVVDYKYVKNAEEDEILEQRPLPASKVKAGRKIAIVMNSGKEPTKVIPDVIDNCSLREAQARLRASGFKLGENIVVAGEKDWVYSLLCNGDTLENGAYVPVGSTISIIIGGGDEVVDDEPIIDDSWFE